MGLLQTLNLMPTMNKTALEAWAKRQDPSKKSSGKREEMEFLSEALEGEDPVRFKINLKEYIRQKNPQNEEAVDEFLENVGKSMGMVRVKTAQRREIYQLLFEKSKIYYGFLKESGARPKISVQDLAEEEDLDKLLEIYKKSTFSFKSLSRIPAKDRKQTVFNLIRLAKAFPEEVDFLKFKRFVRFTVKGKKYETEPKEYLLNTAEGKAAQDKKLTESEKEEIAPIMLDANIFREKTELVLEYSPAYQALMDAEYKFDIPVELEVDFDYNQDVQDRDLYNFMRDVESNKKLVKDSIDVVFPKINGKGLEDIYDRGKFVTSFVNLFYDDSINKEQMKDWMRRNILSPKLTEILSVQAKQSKQEVDIGAKFIETVRRKTKGNAQTYLYPKDIPMFLEVLETVNKEGIEMKVLGEMDNNYIVNIRFPDPLNENYNESIIDYFTDEQVEYEEEYQSVEPFDIDEVSDDEIEQITNLSYAIPILVASDEFEDAITSKNMTKGIASPAGFFATLAMIVQKYSDYRAEDECDELFTEMGEGSKVVSPSVQQKATEIADKMAEKLLEIKEAFVDGVKDNLESISKNPSERSILMTNEKLLNMLTKNKIILNLETEVEE